jgi:hypothetical protein
LHDIGNNRPTLALEIQNEDYERIHLKDAEKKGISVPRAEEDFFGALPRGDRELICSPFSVCPLQLSKQWAAPIIGFDR